MSTLFAHPRIWTGRREQPWASALLVEGELITAVGELQVLQAAHPAAEVIALDGEVVLPGLHDAHIHSAWLGRALVSVDLRDTTSLQEALTRIHAYAAAAPAGSWLFGGLWDYNTWTPAQLPTRQALDEVSEGHPVALSSVDCHTIWINSAGLKAVGIDRNIPDPPGGVIERDAAGEPNGLLRENAGDCINEIQLTPEAGPLEPILRNAQEHLLSVGLTSITDIDGEDAYAAYQQMHRDGTLKLRVTKAVRVQFLEAAIADGRHTGDGDDWVRTGPLKLFSDGALGSHTCDMHDEFVGDPGNSGIATLSSADVLQHARRALDAGIAVATHAIGDRANANVLDAYETVRAEYPDARLRIEHVQHLQPADVERMSHLKVIASMQPTHATSDMDLVDTLLPDRPLVSFGWKTLQDNGVRLAFGSDAPVEEPNPFHALHAAVTRQRADGSPQGGWQPHECISIEDALAAHTTGAAYAAGNEDRVGQLRPGMLADFLAVDTDINDSAHPARIRDAQVLSTVVGGQIRWQRG